MAKVKMANKKTPKKRFATLTFDLYLFATLRAISPLWELKKGSRYEIQRRCENAIAKIQAPGGLPRMQRRKYRELNQKLLAII